MRSRRHGHGHGHNPPDAAHADCDEDADCAVEFQTYKVQFCPLGKFTLCNSFGTELSSQAVKQPNT